MRGMSTHLLKRKSEMEIWEHSELSKVCRRVKGDGARGCQHGQEQARERNGCMASVWSF